MILNKIYVNKITPNTIKIKRIRILDISNKNIIPGIVIVDEGDYFAGKDGTLFADINKKYIAGKDQNI